MPAMCNERDRLIGYVYDECEVAERDAIRQHLESCAACCDEIAALRSVREDLLAWDIPAHQSVWRPFAPPVAVAWWRQVPAWALAAAASLVFVAGAVGGALAQAVLPNAGATSVARQTTAVPVGVTADDLSVSEQRVMSALRTEFEGRLQLAAAHAEPARVVNAGASPALLRQVDELRRASDQQLDLIRRINNNMSQVKNGYDAKYQSLQTKVEDLKAIVLQQGR